MKPRRPNLRWKGDAGYYDHGGKPRKWEHLGDDEAVVLARWQRIHDAGKPEHGTCDKMVADYLDHAAARLAKGTLVNYRIFRGHLGAVFGPSAPHTITQRDVVRYLRTCPRKSARGEIGLLSLAFVYWIEQDRLDSNPCFGVKIKLPTSKRNRLLSWGELDAIIRHASDRAAVAIELGFATGLRISDLCAVRWSDIEEIVDTQKTGARQSFVGTDELRAMLDRARGLQARIASMYVLCARGGRQWTTDALRRQWNAACKRAGVADAHFHDLRAVGATELDRTEGEAAAQTYLGHKSRETTRGYIRGRRPNVVTPLVRKRKA